jgi:uncharacterized protein (TIGR02145 family)
MLSNIKMHKITACIILFFLIAFNCFSQQVIIGDSIINESALVSINSTNKGFLPPRLTLSQREAIKKPATGLMIWCTDNNEMQVFNGYMWTNLYGSSAGLIPAGSTKICLTIWMEKNLTVRTYRNGDSIPVVTDPVQWANLTTGAMCWYNNDTANKTTYGALYNWYAVNDSRGLAPAGWHIAKNVEWGFLINCLGGDSIAGGKIKDAGVLWSNPNTGASNSSGFTALPGGFRNSNGTFEQVNQQAMWWVKPEGSTNNVQSKLVQYQSAGITNSTLNKNTGLSVRCVVLD